jgi:cytoskeleton protein RodZ
VPPVDAGVIASGLDLSDPREADGTAADDLALAGETVGAAIRMRREARGMTLDELSLATRIKPQYLAALEAMRLADLPSRPFVVGYIRACAGALGLDPEQAAERFRREEPDGPQALAAPGGVDRETDPRVRTLVTLGVVVVLAIVAWNIAERVVRHSPAHQAARVAPAVRLPVSSRSPVGPVSLGAPLPPPIESTAPEPYVTPGLPSASSAPALAAAPAAPPLGAPFEARAAVYGLAPGAAHIIFVAAKPVSFVVHGADGSVYFARQLETGEAYAAPQLAGLNIEVSNPAAVNVYVDRAFKGVLPGPTTPLSSLTPAAPTSTPAPAAQP